MKRALRPGFVVTSVAIASCAPQRTTNPPPVETTAEKPADAAPEGKAKLGVHPRDSADRLIFRKSNGTCYVQVPMDGPPPKTLMPGEKWVEDKPLACPKEFDDPAFAAIEDGSYWVQDADGTCSQVRSFGNPPPPPVVVPCPPILQPKK